MIWNIYRSRSSRSMSDDSGASFEDDGFGIEGRSSVYGSQYSFCTCLHCDGKPNRPKTNPLFDEFSRTDLRLSFCER